MAKFKNTEFREGYNEPFSVFKKTHKGIIDEKDMEAAFAIAKGKKPKNKNNGDSKTTAPKS